ncbi:SRPBCC family protein [Halobaculum gomorrense]|uniref:Polyketide cyclase / dehydrase and lipid transport n=1 Tax=Halobaculum gomorrense TaxID=43928 RepID=A0A1M5P9F1_9EURY|nr:SRPBCC family protein [Halobaculum gomorrense]SHG98451.1 Polyketide cyclase / dehydrase and lipid transport [Halobaculum gomorrense]
MDELVVSTDVYVPPEEAYEFLLDFPRYERYSEYLDRVSRTHGDGGAGTRYALRFAWWKLTYTAHSEVTDVDPPNRIDWRVRRDIRAHGSWRIEPLDELPADAPDDAAAGSRVTFEVRFDAESADASAVSLPPLVSFGWVLDKVTDLITEEAERVVRRAVSDLEGRERDVTLVVRESADAL